MEPRVTLGNSRQLSPGELASLGAVSMHPDVAVGPITLCATAALGERSADGRRTLLARLGWPILRYDPEGSPAVTTGS